MPEVLRTADEFVIRELTGPKRTIRLKGRGLPFRPFTLSGGQRVDLTWYAGSPEGTLQVMGAQLDPTTINGRWSDRFISLNIDPETEAALNREQATGLRLVQTGTSTVATKGSGGIAGQPVRFQEDLFDTAAPITVEGGEGSGAFPRVIDSVRDITDLIDEVRRQGQIVEVLWMNVLRRGVITKFKQDWETAFDVKWEITFTWFTQDNEFLSAKAFEGELLLFSEEVNKINDDLALINDNSGSLRSSLSSIRNTVNSFLASSSLTSLATSFAQAGLNLNEGIKFIDRTITDIQDAVFDLEDLAISAGNAVVGAVETAKRAIGLWDFLRQRANDLALFFDNVQDAISLNETSDAATRIAERKRTRDQRRGARRIAANAGRNQQAALKQLNPELVRAFVAREGQDLREISRVHYGTPDSWIALMRYNQLKSSQLSAGQLILVPRTPPTVEC